MWYSQFSITQPVMMVSILFTAPGHMSQPPKSAAGYTCIDLTSKDPPKMIPDSGLSAEDKNILLSGKQLNNKHIMASQKLIKKQFPHVDGLIYPVLVSSNVIFCPPTQEAIQIHHIPGHDMLFWWCSDYLWLIIHNPDTCTEKPNSKVLQSLGNWTWHM